MSKTIDVTLSREQLFKILCDLNHAILGVPNGDLRLKVTQDTDGARLFVNLWYGTENTSLARFAVDAEPTTGIET